MAKSQSLLQRALECQKGLLREVELTCNAPQKREERKGVTHCGRQRSWYEDCGVAADVHERHGLACSWPCWRSGPRGRHGGCAPFGIVQRWEREGGVLLAGRDAEKAKEQMQEVAPQSSACKGVRLAALSSSLRNVKA